MKQKIKKVWNIATTVLIVIVLILAIALVGMRLFGFQIFTVLSGSMEPAYHTGSLIYVKSVDYTQLKQYDVITFMLDENTVATHRIVEVIPDEDEPGVIRFKTKGDANDIEDGAPVHYRNIIGTPVFTIPYLGYVANFIQNPPGSYLSIAIGALILLLVFLPDLLFDDDKKKKDEPEAAPAETSEEDNPA